MKLSIIIPAYNESQTIELLINKIRNVALPYNITREIVIIDDGSTDSTPSIISKYCNDADIKFFRQNTNMGKTSAIKLGLQKLTGDIVIIQDADLEYNPNDYPILLKPMIDKELPVVYGSRFMGIVHKMTVINRIANIISDITVNLLFNTKLTDINTCYKMFRKKIFDEIEIKSKNFIFDIEITVKLLKKGYKIYEVPINYTARPKKEGKKMNWIRALELYFWLILHRFKD